MTGDPNTAGNQLNIYQREMSLSNPADEFLAFMDLSLSGPSSIPDETVWTGSNPIDTMYAIQASIQDKNFNIVTWDRIKDQRISQTFGFSGGLLCLDNNNDGTCNATDGELFGDSTAKSNTPVMNSTEYDSDGDGKISASDDVFNKLRLWFDFHGDLKRSFFLSWQSRPPHNSEDLPALCTLNPSLFRCYQKLSIAIRGHPRMLLEEGAEIGNLAKIELPAQCCDIHTRLP